jgi:hypothetical protein
MDYELKHPKNKVHSKCLRVFHKNSHNSAIRKYSKDMLKYLLVDNEIEGISGEYSEMIEYYNYDNWLLACLFETEKVDDYELKLIMEEKRHLDNIANERWIKVCLYNNKEDKYYLRSISNVEDSLYHKKLKHSMSAKWFIDDATLLADYEFWFRLGEIIINGNNIDDNNTIDNIFDETKDYKRSKPIKCIINNIDTKLKSYNGIIKYLYKLFSDSDFILSGSLLTLSIGERAEGKQYDYIPELKLSFVRPNADIAIKEIINFTKNNNILIDLEIKLNDDSIINYIKE